MNELQQVENIKEEIEICKIVDIESFTHITYIPILLHVQTQTTPFPRLYQKFVATLKRPISINFPKLTKNGIFEQCFSQNLAAPLKILSKYALFSVVGVLVFQISSPPSPLPLLATPIMHRAPIMPIPPIMPRTSPRTPLRKHLSKGILLLAIF